MSLPRLSDDEIQSHLDHLPGWISEGGELVKTYQFKDFIGSLQFVNLVGDAAELMNHHPDIDIRYNRVKLVLVTHDSGGITVNDISLAGTSDSFADAVPAAVA